MGGAESPTRAVVTGADGFIGGALMARLRVDQADADVVGVDRPDFDLANPVEVRCFLERQRPQKILHLAASLARDPSPESQTEQWRDTFTGGRVLLEAAADLGVPHVLVAGSVEELGGRGGVLRTDCPAQPHTVYGLCKSLLREVADFHARRADMRVDWFRPFTVYGPGQLGSTLVPYACQAALAGRDAEFTDGGQERDFLYIEDLVTWLVAALAWDHEGGGGGLTVHHLGTGVGITVREVLEIIAGQIGTARFHLGALPRRENEPERQVAPPLCEQRAPWPWRPTTELRRGLMATAAWWRAREREGAAVDHPAGL